MRDITRLKKIFIAAGVFRILILLLVFSDSVQGLDLQFKISGGYAYLKLSEVHGSLDGWAEGIKIEAIENKKWQVLEENVRSMHSGVNLEGEVLFFFTPRISIGLGAGYIYSDVNEAKAEVIVERPTATISHVFPITVSAYPVTLSGYYFFPLMSKLKLFLRGGSGFVWAKYTNREGRKFLTVKNYNYFELQKASASGSIILAGLGLMYDSDTGVRFFIEGTARLAKIRGFSGENELGTQGMLYHFEEYHPDQDFWQAEAKVMAEEPSGPNFRSVSEAVVDFSGFSAKIGFMIRF
jgi:opacity protein-like surface antigen